MTGKPQVEALAKPLWEMAQRIGMRIAALPPGEREQALASAERSLREAAEKISVPAERANALIKVAMQVVLATVSNIDSGDASEGGHA